MGCAVGTVKFVVFIFNFLLVCLGFAMILFGAMEGPLPEEFEKIPEMTQDYSITSKVMIVAGGIIFVVAFFGCWGAVSDSSCMLFLYAVFLMALILVEAAVGVYVYVHKDTIKDTVSGNLKQWINEYHTPSQTSNAKAIIDKLQTGLQCCGVEGPADWATKGGIPKTCCDEKVSICDTSKAHKEGCLTKAWKLMNLKLKKYWMIVVGIVGVEVLTIIFALIVRNSILNERRRSLA